LTEANAVFVDTSIQIARIIHSPETRRQIEDRLATSFTVTGQIVRLEYKRRLLKDARYLLDLFHRHKSFAKVQRHVVDVLTPLQRRKQRISLQFLTTLVEDDSDDDLTDRAILLLKGLLRDGLYEFDQSVGHVIQKAECGCAKEEVRLLKKRYDFGTEKCTKAKSCGIASFLDTNRLHLEEILKRLDAIPPARLTTELARAADFIRSFLKQPDNIRQLDPCNTVGDLLIAIESAGIPTFYTMNGKESQHLCRAMKQTMVVRPANPSTPDMVCDAGTNVWQEF
jgi:hypothetical protein